MASISFFANILNGSPTLINHTAGSGLGFYGLSFGSSVPIGSQQNTTFVTNSNGTAQGAQLNNTSMDTLGNNSTAGKVSINGSTAINNNNLPNYLCPLNIRFTHDQAVRVHDDRFCALRALGHRRGRRLADAAARFAPSDLHPGSCGRGRLAVGRVLARVIEHDADRELLRLEPRKDGLRDSLMKSGSVPPEFVQALGAVKDWRTTLPVPAGGASGLRQVEVDGSMATISTRKNEGSSVTTGVWVREEIGRAHV